MWSFEKCGNFYPNNFKFCAIKENYRTIVAVPLGQSVDILENSKNLTKRNNILPTVKLGAQVELFLKVAQNLQKCWPPWFPDEEEKVGLWNG